MDTRMTVATDEDNVRAMQKGLRGGFSVKEVEEMIDISFNKHKELKDIIKRGQK
jgi:exosome complex RNA-binding protein Rrp42 (RNase PH superfamily)